jgi:hypothetical protein
MANTFKRARSTPAPRNGANGVMASCLIARDTPEVWGCMMPAAHYLAIVRNAINAPRSPSFKGVIGLGADGFFDKREVVAVGG